MIDDNSKPTHRAGVIVQHVIDELVIYCPATAQAATLNHSARSIWELCDGVRTVQDISLELGERFGLPPDELLADVRAGVDRLYALGLVKCDDDSRA